VKRLYELLSKPPRIALSPPGESNANAPKSFDTPNMMIRGFDAVLHPDHY
jgi:hypothetical protein